MRPSPPFSANARHPPIGPRSLGRLWPLVKTPVWWGYWPVKVEARDTQHKESTTKALSYDAP